MDSTLTFKEHIDKVAAKMAQKIGALWRARRCLSEAARARYVTSVVLPDALYASPSFSGSLSSAETRRLQVLLNQAVRTVYGVPTRHSAQPLLTRLGVFQVSEHFHQNTLALVWKSLHGETSQSVTELMTPQMTRETRLQQQDGLSLPVARTNAGKSRYAFNATGKWNRLPGDVRSSTTLETFKAAAVPYAIAR